MSDANLPDEFPAALAALRRFARVPRAALEKCELCGMGLRDEHQHLLEPIARQLLCACDACAILFDSQAATKYKRVPRRIQSLPEFRLTDQQWNELMIPIGMAFFFFDTPTQKTGAIYPSPAGPVESSLDLAMWQEITAENPALQKLAADVEALLVNRIGARREYFIVPIDECFKLVGLIRANWQGLSGGTEVWRAVENFFAVLRRTVTVNNNEARHA